MKALSEKGMLLVLDPCRRLSDVIGCSSSSFCLGSGPGGVIYEWMMVMIMTMMMMIIFCRNWDASSTYIFLGRVRTGELRGARH